MTPAARHDLDQMLDRLRYGQQARLTMIAATPDDTLTRAIGIADVAACRRIAATPRVARRIEQLLHAVARDDAAELVKANAQSGEPRRDTATTIVEDVPPMPSVGDVLPLLAAAIQLSASGAMIGRSEIDALTRRHGAPATEFALQYRALTPDWMRAIAGDRSEVLNQLAATCLSSLDACEGGRFFARAAEFDPLALDDDALRASAAAFARQAIGFATGADAQPNTGERLH